MLEKIDEHVFHLGVFSKPRIISINLVKGDHIALIESGPAAISAELLQALDGQGVNLGKVSHIIVSHVHIDHAGGAWALLERLPNAKVVVFESGAKHLIDPSRLTISAAEALGDTINFMGSIKPIPPERVIIAKNGDEIDVGGCRISLMAAPGHAYHQMVILENKTKTLFSADALGTYLAAEDALYPASAPASFNYRISLATMAQLATIEPSIILLPHFGAVRDTKQFLQRNLLTYARWHDIIMTEYEKDGSIQSATTALTHEFPEYTRIEPSYENSVVRGFFRASIEGYLHYFKSKLF